MNQIEASPRSHRRLCLVFVTDKRRIKSYGCQEPPGRIRKALLEEVGETLDGLP